MVETLSKFGVPINGARTGMLMPKIKHRFRVRVINFGPIAGGLELTQQVMTVDRPNVTQNGVRVDSYNSIMHYAGKAEWQTLNIEVRDDITNSVSRLVGHQLQKQMNHFNQTSYLSGINYKFTTQIETLDGSNSGVLENWYLEGCYLETVAYDTFNYSESESMMITLTIRYDNATQDNDIMPQFAEPTGYGTMIG